jgi:aspartate aminotransferase
MTSSLFAARIGRIGVSPILASLDSESLLRSQGHDIISFTAGEPDFPTPSHVVNAAYEAMRAGDTRYPPLTGTKALKLAIREKFHVDNGLDYEPHQIVVTSGSKQAIYNAFMATLDAGDEVVIPAPYWTSYPDMVQIATGMPVFVDTCAEQGYQLDSDRLDAAITSRTKWVLLNSPCNPSGAVYSEQTLESVANVLRRHRHVQILCDDIYEHVVFDSPFRTILQVAPELRDRCLIVNGVSKAYAMTGWRLGYAAGPTALIKAMAVVQSQSTSGACSISQAAAVAALTGPQTARETARESYRRRRDMLLSRVASIPGLRLAKPAGAFYALIDCREVLAQAGLSSTDDPVLTDRILRAVGVSVIPGSAFGAPGFIRLSFATADENIQRGLDRLAQALSGLR